MLTGRGRSLHATNSKLENTRGPAHVSFHGRAETLRKQNIGVEEEQNVTGGTGRCSVEAPAVERALQLHDPDTRHLGHGA